MSSTGLHELSNNHTETVDYFVKDEIFRIQELVQPNPPNWGLDRIDRRTGTDDSFAFPTSSGEGVDVYVLDTGVNAQHIDLVGRVISAPSFVNGSDDSSDSNGHGTFVAGVCCGLTFGVAKKANVISVKALTADGEGQMSNVLLALEWVVQRHTANPSSKSVVNLSLSGNFSQTTNDAIQEAIDAGINFAIAAGNDGVDACQFSPASTPNAMTVGATNENDSVDTYSNFGTCVDIYAPGTDITSAWYSSDDASHTLSGTSMASPFVAGVMALYLAEGEYTPETLRDTIMSNSTVIQAQTRAKIRQYDSLDNSSSFHLLYSGNWSNDGIQKIFSVADSSSLHQYQPMVGLVTLGLFITLL
ncbi:unnamed protein product [Umbelopsis sp. WA50703]